MTTTTERRTLTPHDIPLGHPRHAAYRRHLDDWARSNHIRPERIRNEYGYTITGDRIAYWRALTPTEPRLPEESPAGVFWRAETVPLAIAPAGLLADPINATICGHPTFTGPASTCSRPIDTTGTHPDLLHWSATDGEGHSTWPNDLPRQPQLAASAPPEPERDPILDACRHELGLTPDVPDAEIPALIRSLVNSVKAFSLGLVRDPKSNPGKPGIRQQFLDALEAAESSDKKPYFRGTEFTGGPFIPLGIQKHTAPDASPKPPPTNQNLPHVDEAPAGGQTTPTNP